VTVTVKLVFPEAARPSCTAVTSSPERGV
jgi:hypothetical protein